MSTSQEPTIMDAVYKWIKRHQIQRTINRVTKFIRKIIVDNQLSDTRDAHRYTKAIAQFEPFIEIVTTLQDYDDKVIALQALVTHAEAYYAAKNDDKVYAQHFDLMRNKCQITIKIIEQDGIHQLTDKDQSHYKKLKQQVHKMTDERLLKAVS